MGRFVTGRWAPDIAGYGPRRARRGGTFRAYVPEPLAGMELLVDARTLADLAEAEHAAAELDRVANRDEGPHRLEVLARLLLRAEAVGSSQVESLVVSPRRLALAELDAALDPSGRALEVVGNIRALQGALDLASGSIRANTILDIHRRLLEGTRDEAFAGVLRTEQNWVGGQSPLDAEYVPPPPVEVPALVDDLARYVAGDDHPALVQAALAHAQFESIHPFADGNGRTGRALLQLVLRRRGLCKRFVPPVSLVLATWSKRYVHALMSTRSASADGSTWTEWFELLAEAMRLACANATTYERRIDELVERWRGQLRAVAEPRSDAAVWVLLDLLPSAPLLTAHTATKLTGRSERAIDAAISQLVEAGVLKQVSGRIRYRVYEAQGVFALVTETERALASITGDTRTAKPGRAVPARR